ncbi:tetratricopeptide repeat protein, partial [Streptomyces sp. NPDC057638]|uniref:tetratricopeptide repeat protein n=1 Tax=Streptomyces sp. NPDC057638 TaxID=3346190 RepID=UPI003683BDE3
MGTPPPLAAGFQPRTPLREPIDTARREGTTRFVLSGGAGVGKTQLAASYATAAPSGDSAEVVVWIPATDLQAVIGQFARAARRVGVPGADGRSLEGDARAFLGWLATTDKRWLVVLDGLMDMEGIRPWWPPDGMVTGLTLVTTRRGRRRGWTWDGCLLMAVGPYTPDEALAYVRARLASEGLEQLLDDQPEVFARALGCLPLAVTLATACVISDRITTSAYLSRLSDHQLRLDESLPEWTDAGRGWPAIATALQLSLDSARRADPTGLVDTVLAITALLDPDGHPEALWQTDAPLEHLARLRWYGTDRQRPIGPRPDASELRSALGFLHGYALIVHEPDAPVPMVRIHPLAARAIRATLDEDRLESAARAAADALVAVWPRVERGRAGFAALLRANVGTLEAATGDQLRRSGAHPVLDRAGSSYLDAGLYGSAVEHWEGVAARSVALLGAEHPDTLTHGHHLAVALRNSGRVYDALTLAEQVHTDTERVLGPDHPNTLTARRDLSLS